MIRLALSIFLTAAALISISCDQEEAERKRVATEYQKRLPEMERSGVVAGPREKTFEENQGIKLHLPMPENKFPDLLKSLNLQYDVHETVIPTPWHSKKPDISQMQKAYQIYGKVDRDRRSAEIYRAHVDKSGQVVSVENMFTYE